MFREPGGTKLVEMDHLEYPLTDAYEESLDVKIGSGAKDNYGPLFIVNPPISVESPKPLSSDMDSRNILPTKTPSFASSSVY